MFDIQLVYHVLQIYCTSSKRKQSVCKQSVCLHSEFPSILKYFCLMPKSTHNSVFMCTALDSDVCLCVNINMYEY